MKKFILFSACVFIAYTFTAAQGAPNSIPWQAVVRDSGYNILPNQHISLRFTIHYSTATGPTVFKETHSDTTNKLGMVSVQVGAGTVVTGIFDTINWQNGAKYLQVELDPAGGTSYTDMGAAQMLSVPYALYSASSTLSGTAGQVPYYGSSGVGTSDPFFTRSDVDFTTFLTRSINGLTEGIAIGNIPGGNLGDGTFIIRQDSLANHMDLIGEFYARPILNISPGLDTVHQVGIMCRNQTTGSAAGLLLVDSDPVNPQVQLVSTNNSHWTGAAIFAYDLMYEGVFDTVGPVNGIYTDTTKLNFISNKYWYAWPTADGTTGQFLGTDGSGNLSWGNTFSQPLVSKSSSYTLSTGDYTVIFTSTGLTATLPAASGAANRIYVITNKAGGALTISTYVDLTNANNTTVAANSGITLQSDGAAWQQIR